MSKFDNPTYGSHAPKNKTNATHEGEDVFCPVNAYGDCPYCDQCNLCHIDDPIENCDDFACLFGNWLYWERLGI